LPFVRYVGFMLIVVFLVWISAFLPACP
jgi:hypothetical protein